MSVRAAIGAGAIALLGVSVQAQTAFLQSDLGVRGLMRYCKYSNGKVYTVNSTDLCQMSVEEGLPTRGAVGFLQGEYMDGMTKVCVYDVLGQRQALRVGGVELCPLGPRF
jgi:hypothetical protein